MTEIANIDPRIQKIIKELMIWQETEFDHRGQSVRKSFRDCVDPPSTCPDTVLDTALRGLKDMQAWARRGRALDAKVDEDSVMRDCRVGDGG